MVIAHFRTSVSKGLQVDPLPSSENKMQQPVLSINQMKLAEARRKRAVVRAFMEERGLTQAALAKLTGLSKPSVSRALHMEPATNTPALRTLHKLVVSMPTGELGEVLCAIKRIASGPTRCNSTTIAQLLRAVANLIDTEDAGE
jgi:transcriptional regulator with XRE-family HTH domain